LLLSTGKLLRPAGFEALQPEAVSSLFGTSDDFIPRKFPDARRKSENHAEAAHFCRHVKYP
jgi:hypothetical protein